MKEASGEANMTIITIVLIGAVAAVGAIFIPKLLNSSSKKSGCSELGGTLKSDGKCYWKSFENSAEGEEHYCTIAKCDKEGQYKDKYTCVNYCK